jgi:hypothetical protein
VGLGAFLVMLVSFTGAAVIVVWTIALAVGYAKRVAAKADAAGQLSAEELEAIRARLAEWDQREVRVEEIEERLDFVERTLSRPREATPLRNPSEK